MNEMDITRLGNPARPTGEAGRLMLERMNRSHEELTNWALGLVDIARDSEVLDIGCGGGATLLRLLARAADGHITGVDYSEVAVKASLANAAEAVRNGRISVVEGSVEKLCFDSESFDLVTTFESLYFWPDPESNLKEVFRVTKRRGKLLIALNVHDTGALSPERLESIESYRMKVFTRSRLSSMLLAAGFRDIELHVMEDSTRIAAICTRS